MEVKTILLVEDDYLNRRLSKKILLESNFHVLEAKNADEALAHLKKETIDLAILDIHLGDGETDGISLGKMIKDKFPIPFIYLTAYDNSAIISQAANTMPHTYLTKPFKNTDLIAAVEVAIIKSSAEKKHKPFIVVKDQDYKVELPLEDINYIEADSNYLHVHTHNTAYKIRSTIADMLLELPAHNFVQVHRAYIVNKHKIEKYNTHELYIQNMRIPISKKYYAV
jgi:DNA-binding LytR/AlgR family response regulator